MLLDHACLLISTQAPIADFTWRTEKSHRAWEPVAFCPPCARMPNPSKQSSPWGSAVGRCSASSAARHRASGANTQPRVKLQSPNPTIFWFWRTHALPALLCTAAHAKDTPTGDRPTIFGSSKGGYKDRGSVIMDPHARARLSQTAMDGYQSRAQRFNPAKANSVLHAWPGPGQTYVRLTLGVVRGSELGCQVSNDGHTPRSAMYSRRSRTVGGYDMERRKGSRRAGTATPRSSRGGGRDAAAAEQGPAAAAEHSLPGHLVRLVPTEFRTAFRARLTGRTH